MSCQDVWIERRSGRVGFPPLIMSNSEQKLSLAKDAAKVRFPPLVPHMPRHAAPGTNVVEGLGAVVKRGLYHRQQ